jgi:hypothetical protein
LEFHLQKAKQSFKAESFQWLVLAGPRAQLQGIGTLDGQGEYGFMLTVMDGKLMPGKADDLVRIWIWDQATGQVIFDSQIGESLLADPTTPIRGGSIVIHQK